MSEQLALGTFRVNSLTMAGRHPQITQMTQVLPASSQERDGRPPGRPGPGRVLEKATVTDSQSAGCRFDSDGAHFFPLR